MKLLIILMLLLGAILVTKPELAIANAADKQVAHVKFAGADAEIPEKYGHLRKGFVTLTMMDLIRLQILKQSLKIFSHIIIRFQTLRQTKLPNC